MMATSEEDLEFNPFYQALQVCKDLWVIVN